MDVLTDVVTAMRTGPTMSGRGDFRAPWAIHTAVPGASTFHVVLQGTCWLVPDPGEVAPLALGPGDVVLVPRSLPHALADHPETVPTRLTVFDDRSGALAIPSMGGDGARSQILCGAYRLERERPHPMLAGLPDIIHLPADPGRHAALRAATALLAEEVGSERPGAGAVVDALIDAMLPLILRAWLSERAEDELAHTWTGAFGDPAIASALAAVHADPSRPWTVEEMAREASLSRSAFARRFSAATGEPPLTYLMSWRMTVAAGLLRDRGLTMAEVAKRVGYQSEFAFAKAFKRDHRVGPGAYRRQFRSA